MAKHYYAHHCWGGTWWVCADWAVVRQEGQHWPLPLGTGWSAVLLSCPLLLFCFFFPCSFIFFHVSIFLLSPWAPNDYHLNDYTLVCVFILLILQGFSSRSVSQLSNSFLNLSQGHPVAPHQFSPWATYSWMLGWRLRGYSYLEINGTSKWLSGWGMGRSCCISLKVFTDGSSRSKRPLKIVASGICQRIVRGYWTLQELMKLSINTNPYLVYC